MLNREVLDPETLENLREMMGGDPGFLAEWIKRKFLN